MNSKQEQWNNSYFQLKQFIHENNRLPIYSELYIGKWVNRQRQAYIAGRLETSEISLLEQLQCWQWNPMEEQWNHNYEQLSQFIQDNRRLPLKRENHLGTWISNQKQYYKNYKLTATRIDLLEQLSYWSWDTKKQTSQ